MSPGARATWWRQGTENGLALAVLAGFAVLEATYPLTYVISVREDEFCEWATFWAFVAAGVAAGSGVLRDWRGQRALPWYLVGVGLFCVWVALEEISWGQRLFGFRPPAYFLERNEQQEFNLHNLVGADFRILALKAVILGYGVLLPLLGVMPWTAGLLQRLRVRPGPVVLAPLFIACFALYQWYPWGRTGEVVELLLGLGFLFSLMEVRLAGSGTGWAGLVAVTAGVAAVFAAAAITVPLLRGLDGPSTGRIEVARQELRLLAGDLSRLPPRPCRSGRMYLTLDEGLRAALARGAFAAAGRSAADPERFRYFLDPWNAPYRVRYQCGSGPDGIEAQVYSFGPNRQRDTRPDSIGDDLRLRFVVPVPRRR